MHPEEFFTWWLPSTRLGGQWQRSLSKMTREQARSYPGAERDVDSKEIRGFPTMLMRLTTCAHSAVADHRTG